ncbi:zinc ribbon domain-containing protein [Leptogranulimonas caecicola]|uniref:Zinc-ribbon domain-containing protein n=2 Tax=Coriobacteriales TaxID=84999 RepID=A0A4S2EZS0_9ACTN|nr:MULTISPECIES: zinc ribbon domain-containing protein [Atopobiaceae]MCI8675692.1 zinc ribbon domain-containing protein [Atopobiaceae bacterium]TGY62059.1 zinc-ribbon domain-containing protein [Muricaecibacterium torontonense]BCV18831.1 hypothetical protein ATOBIA_N11210 [Atopobiaceae bacterium P1]BDC91161.1 hypothetical protein ATTO_10330 [Leptogranulimonas caecicola]
MKQCPHCHALVSDAACVCPACHAELDLTAALPRLTGSYCPSCGALVPEGADTCPKCGMWVGKREPMRVPTNIPLTDPLPGDRQVNAAPAPDETNQLPRIESAVPSEHDLRDPYLRERPIRMRTVIVAAIACLAIVGGAILLITHPWNPGADLGAATQPADTSKAGFPGAIDSLTGQDTKGPTGEVKSGDETSHDILQEAYENLGAYAKQLDDSVTALESRGFSGTSEERSEGFSNASTLGVEISNTINKIQEVDTTSGSYQDSKDELLKMANWLRNRSDAVTTAWKQAAQSENPQSVREQALSSIRGEAASWSTMFESAYANFSLPEPAAQANS